jgi:hypothetical protein
VAFLRAAAALVVSSMIAACGLITGLDYLAEKTTSDAGTAGGSDAIAPDAGDASSASDAPALDAERPDVVVPAGSNLLYLTVARCTVTSVPSVVTCGPLPDAGYGPQCYALLATGTSVTLTAAHANSYHLDAWTGCDTTSGDTCTFVMTGDRAVTVSYSLD